MAATIGVHTSRSAHALSSAADAPLATLALSLFALTLRLPLSDASWCPCVLQQMPMKLMPQIFVLALLLCFATLVQAQQGYTCVCSSGASWSSCHHYGGCYSFCTAHGGVRYWGGPS
jgi:hypothetical protein